MFLQAQTKLKVNSRKMHQMRHTERQEENMAAATASTTYQRRPEAPADPTKKQENNNVAPKHFCCAIFVHSPGEPKEKAGRR